MNKSEVIADVEMKLDDPTWFDYSLLAGMLYDHVDPTDEPLRKLASLLSSGQYGCSRSDVKGLIELMKENTERLS